MAGKKTDTRQKMINMMYLVFIAMLALNISKEVLATIGVINEDLETSITQLSSDNLIKYGTIDNLKDQPEFKIIYTYVNDLKKVSNTYVSYIQELKDKVLESDKEGTKYVRDVENKSNKNKPSQEMTDYQIMDKSGPLDELFFERSELLPDGKMYEDNFINFRKDLISIIDSIKSKTLNAEISLVVSNKKNAYGLTRAKNNNIPSLYHPYISNSMNREEYDSTLASIIKPYNPD